MNKFFILFLVFFSLFLFTKTAEAKLLPQAKSAKTAVKASGGTGIGVYPKLRADRRALVINFSNLQNARNVSYMLVYQTSTQEEGAMGAINLTGSSSASQELLFGTCSKNICRYHTGINNTRLEISYTTKSGKKYLKKYRIKV